MASAKLNSLAKKLAKLGLDLEALTDMNGVPDAGKLAAAIAKLPEESRDKVVALLMKAVPKGKAPVAPAPPAPPKVAPAVAGTATFLPPASDTPIGEGWQDLVTTDGSFKNSGNAASAKSLFNRVADAAPAQLAKLSRDERELLAAYAYHLNADPATGGGGAAQTYRPLINKTDIQGVVSHIHQFQGDKVTRVVASGTGSKKGGSTDAEEAADKLAQRTDDEFATQGTKTTTDPDVKTSTVTGEPIDLRATPKEIEAFQAKLEDFELRDKKTNIRQKLRTDIHGWTGLGKPDLTRIDLQEADRILEEQKALNPKLWGTVGSGVGVRGRAPAAWTMKTAPVPSSIQDATGATTVAELRARVPVKLLEPDFQAAINDLSTGDDAALRAYYKGYNAKATMAGASAVPPGLTVEAITHLKKTSPELMASKAARVAKAGTQLDEMSGKLSELAGNYTAPAASNPELADLQGLVERAKTVGVKNPTKLMPHLKERLSKIASSAQGPEKHAANLEQIAKQLQEMEKFGPNLQGANPEQLGARASSVAELLKSGKATEAAGKMGLAEGTTLGSMKNVTGTSFFDFLKNHPEKEVRAWAPKIKQAAAQGLGAGAEAGMLESLGAKIAAKGGVIGALGGKMNVAMMVAPLLFQLYSKMKESTEHNRQVELMQLEQAQAPTAKDLLERYRSQRFAEQGVNNMPPSPDFIRRLQSMGPQLTKSEVYIGPDRTEDNLRAMIAQSGDY